MQRAFTLLSHWCGNNLSDHQRIARVCQDFPLGFSNDFGIRLLKVRAQKGFLC